MFLSQKEYRNTVPANIMALKSPATQIFLAWLSWHTTATEHLTLSRDERTSPGVPDSTSAYISFPGLCGHMWLQGGWEMVSPQVIYAEMQ